MASQAPPPLSSPHDDAQPDTLLTDLRQLAGDARTLAEAEFAYQASRAKVAGNGIGRIAALGALAAALVFFALMALVLGAVLGLTALLGAWAATAIVVALLLLATLLAVMAAKARWTRLRAVLSDAEVP